MTKARALKTAAAASVLATTFFALPAQAQEEESAWSISGNASVVSDYRFRGVSLTQENPAVQGGLDVAGTLGGIGLFAGAWGSSGDSDTFGDLELDVYGGVTGDLGAATWTLGVIGYLYPDASDFDYYEVYGKVAGSLGPVGAEVGVYYAPDQANVFSQDNIYIYGSASYGIADTPFTLSATLGYEDGGFADDKIDWSLGVAYAYEMFTLKVQYVDTNVSVPYNGTKDAADAGVVVSLGVTF